MNHLQFDYQKEPQREILCIDCRSFYASVECVLHGWHPLKTALVVLSYPSDNPKEEGSGLILASSPLAKARYGISNVSRARDLPFPYPKELKIVPPRMKLYMAMNQKINHIYKQYCDEGNHHVYSVDESFLDVTHVLKLFNCQTSYQLAQKIQQEVLEKTGIYTTVGIGDNPLLAKLALDNEAKKNHDHIAIWRYQDVPAKLWRIPQLTDFWGIGRKTALKLNYLGISSLYDLAMYDPYLLKERLGVIGLQLYAHSWGIDRSFLGDFYTPAEKSIGNSQVLPRNYTKKEEIILVLQEMSDQVATRLRKKGVQGQKVGLFLGYSLGYEKNGKKGIKKERKIMPTSSSKDLTKEVLTLFAESYQGEVIRQVGVFCNELIREQGLQFDLFSSAEDVLKQEKVEAVVDKIRRRYGFQSIVYAHSLLEGGRAIARSQLVGGHAGGMGGLEDGKSR